LKSAAKMKAGTTDRVRDRAGLLMRREKGTGHVRGPRPADPEGRPGTAFPAIPRRTGAFEDCHYRPYRPLSATIVHPPRVTG